jgi:hypothetical protein
MNNCAVCLKSELATLRATIEYAVKALEDGYSAEFLAELPDGVDDPQPQTMYRRLKDALASGSDGEERNKL